MRYVQVRQVHNGLLLNTIDVGSDSTLIRCMSPVPDQTQLIAIGDDLGNLNLWNIHSGMNMLTFQHELYRCARAQNSDT
jgi:hypothetical protein